MHKNLIQGSYGIFFRMWIMRFLFLLLLAITIACTPARKGTSLIAHDPAFRLFLQGRTLLQGGERIQAEIYFSKALKLRPHFAPALDGLAQVYLEQGHLDMADQYVQQALAGQPKWLPSRLTEARLLLARSEYELAEQKLQALKRLLERRHIKPLHADVLYYLAVAQWHLNAFRKAQKNIALLLKTEPSNRQARQLAKKIERALSQYRDLPEAIRTVAFKPAITREDLARLIVYFFPLKQMSWNLPEALSAFDPPVTFDSLQDVPQEGKADMRKVLTRHIMWGFPTGEFRPKQVVTRGEMAMVLYRLLSGIAGKNRWEDQKTSDLIWEDVPQASVLYPAVRWVVGEQLLRPEGRRFFPQNKISGEQAIAALRALKRRVFTASDKSHVGVH